MSMAWDDDLPPVSKADDPKGAGVAAPPRPRARRRAGLRHLMILIVGCALVFVLARQFFLSWSEPDAIYLAFGVGGLFFAVAAWTLYHFDDAATLGWGLIAVGYVILSVAIF